jgi:hypothetical protein
MMDKYDISIDKNGTKNGCLEDEECVLVDENQVLFYSQKLLLEMHGDKFCLLV